MKIIALAQAYNEAMFVWRAFNWIYDLVDGIVVTEGALTPFGNMPRESPDDTRRMIREWILANDKDYKMALLENLQDFNSVTDREGYEGANKRMMLKYAEERFELEDGDIIFILDFDEFFSEEGWGHHVDVMANRPEINFIVSEEWQFAYNTKLAFKASHGRFMRYYKGSTFGNTNHFKHPDGTDITKTIDFIMPRDQAGFFHMCWLKEPWLVREKVVSFNRPSFTTWYNYVYLVWPFDQQIAYKNNEQIFPYHGKGFCEGQDEPLVNFVSELPPVLRNIYVDHIPYIREHVNELRIK